MIIVKVMKIFSHEFMTAKQVAVCCSVLQCVKGDQDIQYHDQSDDDGI